MLDASRRTVISMVFAALPVVGATTAIAMSAEGSLGDLDVVRQRMIERWTSEGERLLESVRRDASSLRPDGSWSDVDYAHQGRSGWKTVSHLYRVKSMATVYRTLRPDSGDRSPLREATLRALRFWVERDLRNPNWWWNEIGVPMALGPTLVLLGREVPADVKARGVKILERARLGRGTGQNLVWLTEMALIRACVEEKPDVVARAFSRIAEEVRVTTDEGIQPDFSFHQHGAQLYSGGYGFGFSVDVPRIALLAHGTGFDLGREPIETLTRYILDGQQWMVRGSWFDHAAVGREITRGGSRGTGRSRGRRSAALARACDDLIRLGAPRGDELRAFAARLRKPELAPENALSGHRHFWRSDFTVHRRRGYSTSVKMASRRIRGWEIVNSEGCRSQHTADGMQLVYRRGDEYAGIFGVWDWLSIPGATIVQSEESFRGRDARGTTTFVGGVSDGEYGVTAMDLEKGPLHARKAWFFFDREIVCLGSGIGSDAPQPVWTTLNQCRLRGGVTTSDGEGERAQEGVWWAHHDGIGYAVPESERSAVRLRAGPQTGSWHAINRSYPERPETLDVFRLWIDHGTQPRGSSYSYAVVPGVGTRDLRAYRWPVDVLANRPALQAVRHRELKVTGAAFYRPGRVDLGNGLGVEVNEPCVLILREGGDTLELAVASPEHREGFLEVRISAALGGAGAARDPKGGTRVTVELPGGPLAGRSVVRTLRRGTE